MRTNALIPLPPKAPAKAIETRLRLEAKTIREKYLAPPHTTDYAILFVPTEGLYAEALRRPGLVEAMQREHKVMLAGPTTLLATLTSLQMGFRTMALQQRSAEVWEVLGAVKTEFDRFGQALARVKSQTQTVLESIDKAQTRTRADDQGSEGRGGAARRPTRSSCCSGRWTRTRSTRRAMPRCVSPAHAEVRQSRAVCWPRW